MRKEIKIILNTSVDPETKKEFYVSECAPEDLDSLCYALMSNPFMKEIARMATAYNIAVEENHKQLLHGIKIDIQNIRKEINTK